MLPTLATPVFKPMPMSRRGLPSASHFFCISMDAGHHFQRSLAGLRSVVFVFERSAPESHNRVADIFVESTVVFENDLGHVGEILIEEKSEFLRVEFFRDGGEAANVAEHDGDFGFARFDEFGIEEQAANDFGTEILAKGGADAAFFLFFDQGAVERDEQERCR